MTPQGSITGYGEPMSGLSKKVAIVTGASKGIGSGIATALAAAGARVAVNHFSDRQGAERVVKAIRDSGGEAIAVGGDVSKSADVARLYKEVDSAFGRLDILVNNAGVFRFGAFTTITEESFHMHYNINVLGAILMTQEAVKRFGAEGEASSISALSSVRTRLREPCSMRPRKGPSRRSQRGWRSNSRRVRSVSTQSRRAIPKRKGILPRGPLRAAPAPRWLRRHRWAGSAVSLTLRPWRCFLHRTNQPGSPER